MRVYGQTIDDQTRCAHYAGEFDIIAIRFKCCNRYYPCYRCHAESEDHGLRRWPAAQWNSPAIMCGACGGELTISEYMASSRCSRCHAVFNAACRNHWHLYFDTDIA